MRFRIWRSAVAPSDAAEKNRIMGAQLDSHVHNSPKDILENLRLYDPLVQGLF